MNAFITYVSPLNSEILAGCLPEIELESTKMYAFMTYPKIYKFFYLKVSFSMIKNELSIR